MNIFASELLWFYSNNSFWQNIHNGNIVFHASAIYDWQKTIDIAVRISCGNPHSAHRYLCLRMHGNVSAVKNYYVNTAHTHTHTHTEYQQILGIHTIIYFINDVVPFNGIPFFRSGEPTQTRLSKIVIFLLFLFVSTFAYLSIFHVKDSHLSADYLIRSVQF